MAGNYPDASSWRMAYDRDGTQVYYLNPENEIRQLTSAQVAALNNEADDVLQLANTIAPTGATISGSIVFIFPERRDFNGFFLAADPGGTSASYRNQIYIETSVNSTNGLDGSWVQVAGPYDSITDISRVVKPNYREDVITTSALGVRAVRLRWTSSSIFRVSPRVIHVFGAIASGQNPNRLALWHPTEDRRVGPAHFDWGNVPRESSADVTFRVKNMSPTLTAQGVDVSFNALTDTSPSVPGQHFMSFDGGPFQAQVDVGDIGPQGMSDIITLRRVTPANATLSLWTFRIFAEAENWEL